MIQIDMEMPKCCDECFALDDHGDYPFCLISQDQRGYTFNVRKRRMPTCPLKAQGPRVMTLEEVITSKPGTVVWLEDFDKPDVISGLFKRLFIYTKVIDFLIVKEEVNNEVTADLDVYGSEWRCWTSRPTYEQREVTPWNVQK